MHFLTSLLTGGVKRFQDLPRDINSANLSSCKLIHIASAGLTLGVFDLNCCMCVRARVRACVKCVKA